MEKEASPPEAGLGHCRAVEEPLWISSVFLHSPALVWRQQPARFLQPSPGSLTSLPQHNISSGKGTRGFRQLLGWVDLPSLHRSFLGKVAESVAHCQPLDKRLGGAGKLSDRFLWDAQGSSEFLNLLFQKVKITRASSLPAPSSLPAELYRQFKSWLTTP